MKPWLDRIVRTPASPSQLESDFGGSAAAVPVSKTDARRLSGAEPVTVQTNALVKKFGSQFAVDGLDFTVRAGEVFGFLGANGAGKTTVFRMILDIIRPTSGSIAILGRPPGRRNAREIGFLPEERGLYSKMTAEETVRYFGELKGMSSRDAKQRAGKLLDRFGLSPNSNSTIEQLSKGMAQKVQLASALVNEPALLILDEPFSGLDPVNQELLEATIRASAEHGASVIFSTHVMQHAERLCDRLLILDAGKKRFEGTLGEAERLLPPRVVLVTRQNPRNFPRVKLANLVRELGEGWSEWALDLDHSADPSLLLEWCVAHCVPLRRFEQQRPSLHDVFLSLLHEKRGRLSQSRLESEPVAAPRRVPGADEPLKNELAGDELDLTA